MNWVTLDLSADYAEMRNEPHNADYMASCGEYLSARIMAAYLDWSFVDTEFCVFFDEKGRLDRRRTKRALQEKLGGIGARSTARILWRHAGRAGAHLQPRRQRYFRRVGMLRFP